MIFIDKIKQVSVKTKNKWKFEMGIIPNTHKYVFNMCVYDFEILE